MYICIIIFFIGNEVHFLAWQGVQLARFAAVSPKISCVNIFLRLKQGDEF